MCLKPDCAGLDTSLLMEERAESDVVPGKVRPEVLHVYGVDLVGTADLLAFFQVYGPSYVEWINDSSCNVLFPDEFTVKRLVVQMGVGVPNEEAMQTDGTFSDPHMPCSDL
jgi:hypothetical protein